MASATSNMSVPGHGAAPATPGEVLAALSARLESLPTELRKAAAHVLENPNTVGVSSIRELAAAAAVKPNSLVRMARSIGFDGFDDFRAPFREEIRNRRGDFPDRARWLQSLGQQGKLGALYAEMAACAISNIEQSFDSTEALRLKAAADCIVAARRSFVLGVGINHSLAHNFAYLADMAVDSVRAIPRQGSHIIDDLAQAGPRDVLLAMTFKPYRTEVLAAVDLAKTQGVKIIGISDSPAAPLVIASDHGFVVQSDTPQFFPSSVAAIALLETLLAFVIADAGPDIVENIERFHERRQAFGMYLQEREAR